MNNSLPSSVIRNDLVVSIDYNNDDFMINNLNGEYPNHDLSGGTIDDSDVYTGLVYCKDQHGNIVCVTTDMEGSSLMLLSQ